MSIIHEALKRAERERSPGSPLAPAGPGVSVATRPRRRRFLIVVALGVPLLLVSGWFWVSRRDRTPRVRPGHGVVTAVSPPPAGSIDRQTMFRPTEPVPAAPASPPDAAADTDPARLNARAVAYFQEGRREEARRLLEQALRLDPALPEAHNNLGLVFQALGRSAEAMEEYRRALALQPGYPEALNNLGLAWVEEGNQSEAIRSFEEALGSNPRYSSAHLNLAIVYDRLGKRGNAFHHYRRFLAFAGLDERELVSRVNERLRR